MASSAGVSVSTSASGNRVLRIACVLSILVRRAPLFNALLYKGFCTCHDDISNLRIFCMQLDKVYQAFTFRFGSPKKNKGDRDKESRSYAAPTPLRVTYPDNATSPTAHHTTNLYLIPPLAALVITNPTDDPFASTPRGPSPLH